MHIRVRRFFCDNTSCLRRIYAERLGDAFVAFARRTCRMTQALCTIAFAVGGEGGARLAHAQAMPVSSRTLLRLLHASPSPRPLTARVVGIDEWAWKKGRSYGTILVDLERKLPLDLLADRDAKSVASWLQAHQGVEIIARDRSGLFAEAASKGAPQAIQVVDRFHLVKNLVEAVERFFLHKRTVLKAVHEKQDEEDKADTGTLLPVTQGIPSSQQAEATSLCRHAQSVELYETIHDFHAKRVDIASIARHVGASRRTVYRYLQMSEPPERTQIKQTRKQLIEPYKPYLTMRWNEGCRNAQQMDREIRERGYIAGISNVSRFVGQLRKDSGKTRSFKQTSATPVYAWKGERKRPLTARQATRLLVSREETLQEWQKEVRTRLCESDKEIEQAAKNVHRFLEMIRLLQGEDLDAWLEDVEQQSIVELRAFAQGVRKDYQAVKNGLTLSWSNGQTEAQVQRLKLLKRQMYGQAEFPLLRQRVLHREEKLKTQARKGKQRQNVAA